MIQKEIFNFDNLPSKNQIQDILDDLGMLDENGYCPHTAEEIFQEGMIYVLNNRKQIDEHFYNLALKDVNKKVKEELTWCRQNDWPIAENRIRVISKFIENLTK